MPVQLSEPISPWPVKRSPRCHPQECKNYLELKTFENQQLQEDAFPKLPLSAQNQSLQKEFTGHKSPSQETQQPETDSYHQRWEVSTEIRNCLNRCCHKTIISPIHLLKPCLLSMSVICFFRNSFPPLKMVYKPQILFFRVLPCTSLPWIKHIFSLTNLSAFV